MTRIFQEILLLVAQHMLFLLTLAQLLIFIAMGRFFRGKPDAAQRYIAGVLQLFVINGIACFSILWGFIAFLATYTLSFVWYFISARKRLEQFSIEGMKNAANAEAGDETGDLGTIEDIDNLNRYENIDDTNGGAP